MFNNVYYQDHHQSMFIIKTIINLSLYPLILTLCNQGNSGSVSSSSTSVHPDSSKSSPRKSTPSPSVVSTSSSRTASTYLVTRTRKSANLIVTFACCSCPAGVILLCVVGTTLSCSTVWAVRDIHTSVPVHYFLYSGRSDQRGGHSPDTVASDTSLRRGSCRCP